MPVYACCRPLHLLRIFAIFICLGLAHLVIGSNAVAQVNTEVLRVGDHKPGFGGLLGVDLDVQSGTIDYFELTGNGQLNYHYDIHHFLLSGKSGYGTTQGDAFLQQVFAHARWTAMWHKRVGSEVFTQLEYDRFLRQNIRALFGTGPRILVIQTDQFESFWGVAYMLEREELNIPDSDPHPSRSLNHRLTTYLSLKWNPAENVSIIQTLYVQPRLDRFRDVRMLEQADLRVSITNMLSIKTSITVRYDSRPPQEVAKTNTQLTQGIDLQF